MIFTVSSNSKPNINRPKYAEKLLEQKSLMTFFLIPICFESWLKIEHLNEYLFVLVFFTYLTIYKY